MTNIPSRFSSKSCLKKDNRLSREIQSQIRQTRGMDAQESRCRIHGLRHMGILETAKNIETLDQLKNKLSYEWKKMEQSYINKVLAERVVF